MSGKDSETHTKRAIHLMRKEIHRKEKCMHSSLRSIKRDLSNGLASLCELYMTDLCDEDEAEENCIRCADEAIDVDPNNPDAYLPKTSYLLMKGQVTGQDGARSLLEKSVSLWLPGATALRLNQTPPPGFSEEMIPCYPQRTAAAKLAIELEMWDAASEILEGLLEEKDDVIETWYLSGVACHLQKDVSSARMYFENALTVAEKTPKDELSHEMMEDIREKLRTLPPKEESEDNVTDDDDDGSDDNSEDEVMDADDGDR
ncbi:unnamed protein product [Cyprideis torosa]|uniref:Uncharacterized protein n=1 Tax=Cyprideis torosa TaxID=163714 RepID=A0A7R8WHD0_9CRUS|nr:unnamed protein product [Cyprideis torosa]CAG0899209.1 unnamed protein product [Cyprideis torosa]